MALWNYDLRKGTNELMKNNQWLIILEVLEVFKIQLFDGGGEVITGQ